MNLSDSFKKPEVWIWLASILLIIFHLAKLIAIIGPPIIVILIANTDKIITAQEIAEATSTYLQEASARLNINLTTLKYTLSYSGISSLLFVALSPFIGLGKRVVRNIVLGMIGLEIVFNVSLSITNNTMPSWGILCFYLIILTILLTPRISIKFEKSA